MDVLRETLVSDFKNSRLIDESSNVDDDGIHDPAVIEQINEALLKKAKEFYYDTVKECVRKNNYSRFGVLSSKGPDGVRQKTWMFDAYEDIIYLYEDMLDEFKSYENISQVLHVDAVWSEELAKLFVITSLEAAICNYLTWSYPSDKLEVLTDTWINHLPSDIQGNMRSVLERNTNRLMNETSADLLNSGNVTRWSLLSVSIRGYDITLHDDGDYRIHAYYSLISEGHDKWPLGRTPQFVVPN